MSRQRCDCPEVVFLVVPAVKSGQKGGLDDSDNNSIEPQAAIGRDAGELIQVR